jgi:hypothetical protein
VVADGCWNILSTCSAILVSVYLINPVLPVNVPSVVLVSCLCPSICAGTVASSTWTIDSAALFDVVPCSVISCGGIKEAVVIQNLVNAEYSFVSNILEVCLPHNVSRLLYDIVSILELFHQLADLEVLYFYFDLCFLVLGVDLHIFYHGYGLVQHKLQNLNVHIT